MENKIMYAPDGWNKDGSKRPWARVEIIERESSGNNPDFVKIRYNDGKEIHCYINSLSESSR